MYGDSLKVQRLSIHEHPSESVRDPLKKGEDIVSTSSKSWSSLKRRSFLENDEENGYFLRAGQ
jgi:hypothetical protein